MSGKKGKRFIVLILVAALALTLTGCWDRTEIDELGFILAIGLDLAPKGDIYYTFWLAVPRKLAPAVGGGGGGIGAGEAVHVATVEASTLGSALSLMNTYVARRLTLEHTKAFVVGEELARRDILEFLSPAARFREFRRSILVMVTRGTARDYLQKNKPSIEENPARWVELMTAHQSLNALTPKSTVHEFLLEEESNSTIPVAVLTGLSHTVTESPPGTDGGKAGGGGASPGQGGGESGQGGQSGQGSAHVVMPLFVDGAYLAGDVPRYGLNPAEVIGGAVFYGTKMIAELNGDEVRLLTMLRGNLRRAHFAQPDPKFRGYYVELDLRQARSPTVRVAFDGDRPIIDAKVHLEGDITAIQSFWDWTDPSSIPILEQAVGAELTKHAQALVDRAKKEFHGDPFNFGDHARGQFRTWKDWSDYHWNEHFPQAEVTVSVDFKVRRVGLQLSPSPPPAGEPQPAAKGQGQGGANAQ